MKPLHGGIIIGRLVFEAFWAFALATPKTSCYANHATTASLLHYLVHEG